jgi:hypothetical protein
MNAQNRHSSTWNYLRSLDFDLYLLSLQELELIELLAHKIAKKTNVAVLSCIDSLGNEVSLFPHDVLGAALDKFTEI